MTASKLQSLGLFGGTFDPVHYGHLRMALEFKQRLVLDEMRLLPCHVPPHREAPGRSSEDRAAMVRLAVADCPDLSVDERELKRDEPSYTVETLAELRRELGDHVSLCWCVGMDSLVNLNRWHRWRELLDLAHLVVAARPGWSLPQQGDVAEWYQQHQVTPETLHSRSAGGVVIVEQSLLDISATSIRELIAAGQSPEFLLPDAVRRYIEDNRLYLS
ncbi:nicotinate-nucleotide adenylyltransferase [Aestuariicella sp. G3-2]|uniref:nicotinate-nucleotide adenylyltransferase n=1 Tax=Pseudomaricurvus albidus TaxID=2842452 RepID=UPI001C0B33BE|nr:nicotinate-nucleotide adenylyltransferase [Aestuariicella albida]MBU3069780.1 nicotinate-nucleotide adenylyltransferase [Aestuariicella albida]